MSSLCVLARPLLFAATATLLLQGCSSSGEDPRITMCRGLAADLSSTEARQWKGGDNRFVYPEYAVVNVAGDSGDRAACWYEYDAVEESALDHANPLLAYATLPYQMTLNEVQVAKPTLKAAITLQQKEAPAKALEEARKAVEMANEQMRRSLEGLNNR